nr:hypothetical protein GCM10020093_092120 [Planobispora longispora]
MLRARERAGGHPHRSRRVADDDRRNPDRRSGRGIPSRRNRDQNRKREGATAATGGGAVHRPPPYGNGRANGVAGIDEWRDRAGFVKFDAIGHAFAHQTISSALRPVNTLPSRVSSSIVLWSSFRTPGANPGVPADAHRG